MTLLHLHPLKKRTLILETSKNILKWMKSLVYFFVLLVNSSSIRHSMDL